MVNIKQHPLYIDFLLSSPSQSFLIPSIKSAQSYLRVARSRSLGSALTPPKRASD
jgi:hypothetical protein